MKNKAKTRNQCKPVFRSRVGRFQVSLWKVTHTVFAEDEVNVVREFDRFRICIQHSQRNWYTKAWKNQNIWCDLDDVRNLANAIDELVRLGDEPESNPEVSETSGEDDSISLHPFAS